MQSVLSRIWTRVAVSISYDDNDYTTGTSNQTMVYIFIRNIIFLSFCLIDFFVFNCRRIVQKCQTWNSYLASTVSFEGTYVIINLSIYLSIWNCLSINVSILLSQSMHLSLSLYIYIYIYSHPSTKCFVVSQLFRVARHGIFSKLESKTMLTFMPAGDSTAQPWGNPE